MPSRVADPTASKIKTPVQLPPRRESKNTHAIFLITLASMNHFYAPQLYRQVLLRRVLAMKILSVRPSVCPSVCHDPVAYQDQVRDRAKVTIDD